MLAIFSIFSALFLSIVLLILYRFVLRPYALIQFYKKQGAATDFYPIASYPIFYNDTPRKGDFYYHYKELQKNNPKLRFVAENFGTRCFVTLLDPNMIKEVLYKYETYQKDSFCFGVMMRLAAGSSILAEGAEWKKGRRLISSAFNFEFLKHMVPMIVETAQQNFDEWIALDKLKDIEIIYPFGEITGEVTGRFFFGKNFGHYKVNGVPLTKEVTRLLSEVGTECYSPWYIFFGPRFSELNILPRHRKMNREVRAFKDRCREIIQEIEQSAEKGNYLLSTLLDQRKSGENEGGLTNEQIVGEFIGLFAAGTETTSHLLNSSVYFLCKHPEVFQKVKEEIDREFADEKNVTIDNLNRMDYLAAFFKETLRLGGPIDTTFFRNTMKDDELCGIKIKKGTLITTGNGIQYTYPQYYKDPNTFRPERWLATNIDDQDPVRAEPYGFLPFSAGPRNCIGQHFAIIEAKIVLAMFVKRFDFSIPQDYKMVLVQRFVYEPFYPVKVTLMAK